MTSGPAQSVTFDPALFNAFVVDSFDFDTTTGQACFRYSLHSDNSGDDSGLEFVESWSFPTSAQPEPRHEAARRLARLLCLALSVSYYKMAAPKEIRLRGEWSRGEVEFLRALIEHGLAEFAYVNELALPLRPSIIPDAVVTPQTPVVLGGDPFASVLTPVGGGKDSCVSIEAIRGVGTSQQLFAVGRAAPILAVAEASGIVLATAGRALDPQIAELNAAGALNGHVPVTSINSVAALISAVLLGAGAVIMSNEKSASTQTLDRGDIAVNHQWSKSIDFERMLRSAVGEAVSGLDYVSLLRPYSEYRIAEAFATHPEYFDVFVSCGRAFKQSGASSRWCRECDKCRFVALILAPFLERSRVEQFMGGTVLTDSAVEGFRMLLGLQGERPFDCVGEIGESRLALLNALPSWQESDVFMALRQELGDWAPPAAELTRILDADPVEHCLPAFLSEVLDAAR